MNLYGEKSSVRAAIVAASMLPVKVRELALSMIDVCLAQEVKGCFVKIETRGNNCGAEATVIVEGALESGDALALVLEQNKKAAAIDVVSTVVKDALDNIDQTKLSIPLPPGGEVPCPECCTPFRPVPGKTPEGNPCPNCGGRALVPAPKTAQLQPG